MTLSSWRTRWRRVVVLLCATALLVSGCSDDDDDNGTTAGADADRVRVVSQNLLHGIACPTDTESCALPARVELFVDQLEDAACPELVGVQEANETVVGLLRDQLPASCGDEYEIVWDDDPGIDREVVLTTLPVLGTRRVALAGPLRSAFWVRVASDVGVVDFVSTHLASSSDDRPCDTQTCAPPCVSSDRLNTCQMREVLALVDELASPDAVVVVGGDLNAQPDEPTVDALRAAGFVDTHLAAGNPECDPQTGTHCTTGRADEDLDDLTDPQSIQSARIDYLWRGGSRDCREVEPTGLFAAEPADDGQSGLAYASDHTGVQATIECETTPEQRAAALDDPLPTTTTTEPGGSEALDDATRAAVTEAFETVFNGDVTDVERKLTALEDGELLRDYFVEQFEAVRPIASRIRIRLDEMAPDGPDRVAVVYTLLLEEAAVLDHVPGAAVRVGDDWLVSRRTYCDVSTQGADEIPPPCQ